MRIAPVAFALAALLTVPAVQADDVSYNFLDVAYANVDIDDFNEDADGFQLRASFEVTDAVFMFGSYSDLTIDLTSFDVFLAPEIDLREYDFGLGYAWPVGHGSSLYGAVRYVSVEAETFDTTVDDDGFGAALGLRTRPAPNFELEAYADYVDLSDSGTETSIGLGARLFLTPQFALAAEALFGEDSTAYGVGLRWHWGN